MDLKQQLKQLNTVSQADLNWVAKNRAELLSQMSPSPRPSPARQASLARQARGEGVFGFVNSLALLRERARVRVSILQFYPRFAATAMAAVILFVASTGLTAAAKNTLPGHFFYPVKLALEKTGTSLIPDKQIKSRVQMELAGERLNEARKVADGGSVEAGAKASQALDQFKEHLADLSDNLDPQQIAQTSPQKAAEMSHQFVKRSKDYEKQLTDTAAVLPEPMKNKAETLKRQVGVSSLKAMGVLTAAVKMGVVSNDQVVEDMQEAVAGVEIKVKAVETKTIDLRIQREKSRRVKDKVGLEPVSTDNPLISTEMAKKMLGEAKDLISTNDLDGALNKVKDSSTIINRAEDSDALKAPITDNK